MSKEYATILAACIAAVVSIVGLFIKYRLDTETEFAKWRRAFDDKQQEWLDKLQAENRQWQQGWKDEVTRDTRKVVGDLTRKIAAGIHSMQWLTWKARQPLYQLNDDDIQNYDKEMHALFPELVGPLMVLATLDVNMYETMNGLVQDIINYDKEIAYAVLESRKLPTTDHVKFSEIHSKVNGFYVELPKKVSTISGIQTVGKFEIAPRT